MKKKRVLGERNAAEKLRSLRTESYKEDHLNQD